MKISKIISMFFFSIIFIYILMFLDTNSLFKQIEQHMLGEIELTPEIEQKLEAASLELNNKSIHDYPINDDLLMYKFFNFNFRKKNYYPTAEKDKIELKLRRNFVIHNFKDGVINFTYTMRYYDKDGEIGYAIGNSNDTFTIHKENGRWHVIDFTIRP